jgi:mono/diheme cytochrome c family protein
LIVALGLASCLAVTVAFAQEETLLERGTYLVQGIVACGNCHTPKNADGSPVTGMELAGSFTIKEPVFTAYAANITPDEETGIGTWSDDEIVHAIRDGIRPDGSIIGPPMPSLFYRDISDRDAKAIVAYLRAVPAVRNVIPKSEYNMPLPPAWGPPVGEVPDVSKNDAVAYANYVTNTLGHCMECHTPMTETGQLMMERMGEGGRVFSGIFGLELTTVSSNVTPHELAGIGEWSDAEIVRAITGGVGRDGRELAHAMAFDYYENISDEDLTAIVTFLRSLSPLPVSPP